MSELQPVQPLNPSPFKCLVATVGNIPTSFAQSLSYFEALQKLAKYIQDTLIPALNGDTEAIVELQDKYNELKIYIDTYFDNLDVQEEINNKLDDMAEQGQLADIIAQYLQLAGVLAFDTVADMQAGTNLVNGSTAKTLGKDNYLDGGGRFYKIRNITNDDTVDGVNIISITADPTNTLIAELIPEDVYQILQEFEEEIEYNGDILFIGDSWTTEYPSGTNMWYMQVAERLNLNPLVYGVGGSGFVHIGAGGKTFIDQVTKAASEIENKNRVKIVAITGGINDYHDDNVAGDTLRSAVSSCIDAVKLNFPKAEIVYTPLNFSYELLDQRAIEIYNSLKNGAIGKACTILTGCYNWIKTFPESYAYYDTHMNQTGNNIFASSWLSSYHGKGLNHTHLYIPYPKTGISVLQAQASVCGSKVSIYAQLQVASGTTLDGNCVPITFDNNVVGLPLYPKGARAVTAWVNLGTTDGQKTMSVPAYLNIKPYPNTSDNQGELEVHLLLPSTLSVNNNSSYIYISADIDTFLSEN